MYRFSADRNTQKACCYTDVRLSVRPSRGWITQNEPTYRNSNQAAGSFIFQLGPGIRLPLSDAFVRRSSSGERHQPLRKRVSPKTFLTAAPKRLQLAENFDHALPLRLSPNLSGGFETPFQSKQISKLAFYSRKTTFKRQKCAADFRFERTSCNTITEPSLNIKIFRVGRFFRKISPVFRTRPTRKSRLFNKRRSTVMILPNLLIYRRRV
jgi:hypothetical protein